MRFLIASTLWILFGIIGMIMDIKYKIKEPVLYFILGAFGMGLAITILIIEL